jgi:hypothetical protein
VSNYIHSLEVGAMVNFKHIAFNIKKQYPFTVGGPLSCDRRALRRSPK